VAVATVGEADLGECRVDARPDLGRWYAGVFEAERDVITRAGERELRLRVLEQDADPAARRRAHLARAFAGVVGQEAGERGEQRALARPGRAEQQHALTALDAEVDVADRPCLAAGVAPAEAAQLDGHAGVRPR
jgi:hypothetical protein